MCVGGGGARPLGAFASSYANQIVCRSLDPFSLVLHRPYCHEQQMPVTSSWMPWTVVAFCHPSCPPASNSQQTSSSCSLLGRSTTWCSSGFRPHSFGFRSVAKAFSTQTHIFSFFFYFCPRKLRSPRDQRSRDRKGKARRRWFSGS